MSQLTFGEAEYAGKRKTTRREAFLTEMDQVVPWKSLMVLRRTLRQVRSSLRSGRFGIDNI